MAATLINNLKTTITYQPQNIKAFTAQAITWAEQFEIVQFTSNNGIEDGFKQLLAIQFKQNDSNIQLPSLKTKEWHFGFIGYDFKNKLDDSYSKTIHDNKFEFPDIYFFKPDILIEFDKKEVKISATNKETNQIIYEIENNLVIDYITPNVNFKKDLTFNKYKENFNKLKDNILQGNIYITNYCISLSAENQILNPIDVFLKLNKETPTPYSSYLKYKSQYVICASPERFIKKYQQSLICQPIKGTSPRGNSKIEDQLNIEKLRNSEKEKSENVMIVDLVRNDFSRICNQVKVDELFGIYTFETVHQMISTISGQLNKEIDFQHIIESTFPMGSMTGAPKINAVNLSNEFETFNRELYSGSIGYIEPGGDFDFNVVIRSILHNKLTNFSSIRVGSAITYSADAHQEWEECLLKAKSLLKILS